MFKARKICDAIEEEQKAKLLKKFKSNEKFPKILLMVNLNKVPEALYADARAITKLYAQAAEASDAKKQFAVIEKVSDKKVDNVLSKFYGKKGGSATCVDLMYRLVTINNEEQMFIIATCTTRA